MRFKVVEGSESGHCCFVATVVDTEKTSIAAIVCECLEPEDAQRVADALNRADGDGGAR